MYIVDNGFGYEVWIDHTKVAEFVSYDEAIDFICNHE